MHYQNTLSPRIWSLFTVVLLAIPLQAQTPAGTFEELRDSLKLKEQENIEVTEESGEKYKAKIAAVSEDKIIITVDGQRREVTESQVREIRHRRPDKWWNGMLIGLGAGIASAVVAVPTVCGLNDDECTIIAAAVFLPTFAGIGMGAGAAIDYAIKKHETVFARPTTGTNRNLRVSPILGKKTAGVNVSYTF
jgi:hypothetical protein